MLDRIFIRFILLREKSKARRFLRLPGLTRAEAEALRAVGFTSCVALWQAVQNGGEEAIARIAQKAGLSPRRLARLLAADVSPSSQRGDVAALGGVVALAILVGVHFLAPSALQVGLHPVVVAARELKKGQRIRPDDLAPARAVVSDAVFTTFGEAMGSRLRADVAGGAPLRRDAVEQLWVVAKKDLLPGVPLERGDVALVWKELDMPEIGIAPLTRNHPQIILSEAVPEGGALFPADKINRYGGAAALPVKAPVNRPTDIPSERKPKQAK